MLLLPLFAAGGAMTSGSVPADAEPCDSPIAAWTQQGSLAMASGSAGGFRQQLAQQGMGGSTGDVFNSLFANWNRDTLITTPEARLPADKQSALGTVEPLPAEAAATCLCFSHSESPVPLCTFAWLFRVVADCCQASDC